MPLYLTRKIVKKIPDSMQIERESTEKCGGEYKRPAVSLQSKKSAPACATFKNDD